eukprot:ANDGO_08037.mRNA.1 hypothetical protein
MENPGSVKSIEAVEEEVLAVLDVTVATLDKLGSSGDGNAQRLMFSSLDALVQTLSMVKADMHALVDQGMLPIVPAGRECTALEFQYLDHARSLGGEQ